ncbi:MAG: molybdopterin-dependent oxidoreductase [Candidatus Aramenus sp.]|nr:molybdopterin-dependent oxidoreductase [Candidatus Aramenus sp.]
MRTICPYCGVGCGIVVKEKAIVPENYVTNKGMLCIKGATLLETLDSGRLLYPQLDSREVTWEKALDYVANKIRRASRRDKDSVAIYVGAQIPTEDIYLSVKLGKGYLGTASFDSNVRLCMVSAAYALKYSFDDPSPSASYDEIDSANTFFLVGVNPASSFPVLWNRIVSNKLRKKAKVIVVDPIFTDSAQQADVYVRVPPGKDVLLLGSIANELIRQGVVRIRPEHFEEFKESVSSLVPERVSRIIGVSERVIRDLANTIANSKTLFMWGMGVNQTERGVETGVLISTLAMLTGNVGEEGTGVLPLTGQHNSMGAREAGALAGMLPGLRYVDVEEEVEEVEDFWGIPRYSIPRHYYTITEIYKLMEDRRIKVLWVIATNPVKSLPRSLKFKELLSYVDTVVVQDSYHTETVEEADVVFPAASWSEREGIHTAGDRTVGKLNAMRSPPGEALPDWRIVSLVGTRLGFNVSYSSVEEVFNEFKALTRGRLDDISGLTYHDLERGYRWPNNASTVRPKVFKTRPIYLDWDLLKKEEDWITIITGRTKGHWNTMTRTSRSFKLKLISEDNYLFLPAHYGKKLGVKNEEYVEVATLEGRVKFRVKLVDWIRGEVAFAPFHWGEANKIMDWRVDRESKEPSFKQLRVLSIRKASEQ